MTGDAKRVISIGECMVELARVPSGHYAINYGGDTFNTAVYLARAGLPVGYATALGDDPYSDGILALARRENIATDLVEKVSGRMPGLYLIETTDDGERTFHYWRDRAPARELFERPSADILVRAMQDAALIYFSGITLSLYSAAGLDRFAEALAAARAEGVRVAMDGNYRPRGWHGDRQRARLICERFWRLTDIALPTFEDEGALWGDSTPETVIARLRMFGVREIAIKRGAGNAICVSADGIQDVPVPSTLAAVDTTAAGDSFNAAYLAARLRGQDAATAALRGHRLAGIVIQHRGAVVPYAETAAVLKPGA